MADDIIKYLTGISLRQYIENEKKRIFSQNNFFRESTVQKLMQVSLKQIRSKFTSQEIEKLEQSFYRLCSTVNSNERNPELSFINEDSFITNFSSIFYYENRALAKRVFAALTGYLP